MEAYAKQGYVGTVGGINIYTKKNAETGKVVIATKEAVTLFNKKVRKWNRSVKATSAATRFIPASITLRP